MVGPLKGGTEEQSEAVERPVETVPDMGAVGGTGVYHTKVLSGTNKERNQWDFCVVKGTVFLDKGITNRTIGQI